jgi:hypothetical protein
MTEKTTGNIRTDKEYPEKITFNCAYCKENRPIEDMRTIRRFFPVLVVCRDCEERIR